MKQKKYKCFTCKEFKSIDSFYKDSTKKYKIRYLCIPCSKTYREEYKERIRESGRKYRQKLKLEIFSVYSKGEPKCNECGYNDIRALCVDHIAGRGSEHYKKIGGVGKLYSWIRKNNFPEGFQILCMNCNFIKEVKEGYINTKEGIRRGKMIKEEKLLDTLVLLRKEINANLMGIASETIKIAIRQLNEIIEDEKNNRRLL